MGLFTDSVPRDLYDALQLRYDNLLEKYHAHDALQLRYDNLLEKYHALRPTHSPVAPMKMHAPREDTGTATLHAAEAAVADPDVARAADSILRQQPELSREAALREAKRLVDIARGRAVAPSAASPPEPPGR